MASETPGGLRPRRRASALDSRSTDKIYRSGDVSTVKSTAADSTLKPGEKVKSKAVPTKRKVDERSTDRYYRELTVPAGTVPAPVVSRKKIVAPPKPAVPAGDIAKLVILSEADVKVVIEQATTFAQSNRAPVTVHIANGQAELLRRARTQLELLVTRQALTEDDSREIKFVYLAKPAVPTEFIDPPTPPVPTETKVAASDIKDPLEFLNADMVEEPAVNTDAVTPAVLTSDDQAPDTFVPEIAAAAASAVEAPVEIPTTVETESTLEIPATAETLNEISPELAEAKRQPAKTSGRGVRSSTIKKATDTPK